MEFKITIAPFLALFLMFCYYIFKKTPEVGGFELQLSKKVGTVEILALTLAANAFAWGLLDGNPKYSDAFFAALGIIWITTAIAFWQFAVLGRYTMIPMQNLKKSIFVYFFCGQGLWMLVWAYFSNYWYEHDFDLTRFRDLDIFISMDNALVIPVIAISLTFWALWFYLIKDQDMLTREITSGFKVKKNGL